MSKHPWVVLKYDCNPNLWICERCEEKIEQLPNMNINLALEFMEGFLRIHKKCKVKK